MTSTRLDDLIESTAFSVDFVLKHVRRVSGNEALLPENLRGINVLDITGGSAFFARVLKVSFEWKDSQMEPKSVVLKVPRVQEIASPGLTNEEEEKKEDADHVYLEVAHSREVQFYSDFANRPNGLRLPVFYYGSEYSRRHDKGVLIMEDLSRFSTTVNILPGLTNEQIENLIDELARLVALSWKERSWVEPMVANPEEEQEDFIQEMRSISLELNRLDARFKPLLERLAPLYTVASMDMSSYKEDKYGFPAALVHGDLWAPNILWRTDENGAVTSKIGAVIDWQCVHAGNPLEDVGRLLVLNTTSAYRRANQRRLLQLYVEKLREYCGGESPLHEENVDDAFCAAMPYVTMFLGFGVPMYCSMPSVVRQDPKNKAADSAELLDRTFCFFEEVIEAYGL
uniref:CHK domain-containing protein n=1 Tax=Steinernema glaseri TaxID=37863 RepID=A0A1I7YVX7_9BILA